MLPILYLVIPCYNEEEVLPGTSSTFADKLRQLMSENKISAESRVLFVNDGSKDGTWKIIQNLAKQDPIYIGVSLSRNQGHQKALWAGLMEAKAHCEIAISIDCDGQDDINAVDKMVDEYGKGADIVYGVRSDRRSDSPFKRTTAQGFYRIMKWMGAEVVYNHADYRLLSARVLVALSQYHEVNLFLRGLVPLVGFHSTSVYYERKERTAGKTHYPLRKMLSLAFDGITSLSVKPIRIITALGFLVAAVSLIGILWSVAETLVGNTVSGWASTVSIICFIGGIQLLSLGVIGEYIGKIYLETKHRPPYFVAERTEEKNKKEP